MSVSLTHPKVHVSGRGWKQKWFQTVNVSHSTVRALWLFWCKGPNKPRAGHDLTDLNQMCSAFQALLKDFPYRKAKCERQSMFFFPPWLSSEALIRTFQQQQQDSSQARLFAHKGGLHNIICHGVIRQDFRQIHKSLLKPTFWRLP